MAAQLPDFEGTAVRKAVVRVTKAGDGLSEALSFEPIALHHGDRVHLVLSGVVTQVNHKPDGKVEDGEVHDLVRVHTIEADEIALVDAAEVAGLLDANRERLEVQRRNRDRDEAARREAEAGAMGLPGTGDAAQLAAEHGLGGHADGLVDGCEQCDDERQSEEDGD